MKKQEAQFSTAIEAQVPSGVSVSFREESSLNPSQIIILTGVSSQNATQSENAIRGLLNTLLAEL